ncbi:MAG: hypothetical protein QM784_35395 [Polyangiaceae bacterium]
MKEFSAWHGTAEYSVTVSQVVSGIIPGTYSFKGSIASDKCQQAYLFARNCGGAEQQVPIPTDNWNWREFSIPSIEVTGSSCEVGFFLHNIANDWLNADHFAFELLAKTTP